MKKKRIAILIGVIAITIVLFGSSTFAISDAYTESKISKVAEEYVNMNEYWFRLPIGYKALGDEEGGSGGN